MKRALERAVGIRQSAQMFASLGKSSPAKEIAEAVVSRRRGRARARAVHGPGCAVSGGSPSKQLWPHRPLAQVCFESMQRARLYHGLRHCSCGHNAHEMNRRITSTVAGAGMQL